MTEKRFIERYAGKRLIGIEDIETGRVCVTIEENIRLLNELNDENEQLKSQRLQWVTNQQEVECLTEENEQLKATMQEVAELLSEEVDLFSDKAIEHDINAYIELTQLDNKDAYYMAVTTKKAIKMLKGDVE